MNDELEQLEAIIKKRISDFENIINGKHSRSIKKEVEHEINALHVVLRDISKIRKNRGI
ncbi:MAG: hypothetical protein NC310_00425 [Roseburia sp.]|nr:hypothetical protein [Anaeroplasma bactoclasticum]MCM1195517.1 hypothetical protein [Roseburia sp.]